MQDRNEFGAVGVGGFEVVVLESAEDVGGGVLDLGSADISPQPMPRWRSFGRIMWCKRSRLQYGSITISVKPSR